jgi:hypothetical protein
MTALEQVPGSKTALSSENPGFSAPVSPIQSQQHSPEGLPVLALVDFWPIVAHRSPTLTRTAKFADPVYLLTGVRSAEIDFSDDQSSLPRVYFPLPENWTVVELPFARPQRRLTWAQAL